MRNLLGHAINKLIELGHISRDKDIRAHYIRCTLLGKESVIIYEPAGFNEILVSVWWDYNPTEHYKLDQTVSHKPQTRRIKYKRFVSAVVGGWIERDMGFYLQGRNKNSLTTRYMTIKARLELRNAPICEPNGFELEGDFLF
ncbi:hypothetical protein L4D09_17885 [Photobacterium makurazakiensis]|uniref:hypothetical protein n=1 Tax=Photobacterium makurazakiensis TaxID=2910234 RepID=UPI003D0CE0E7